VWKVLEMEEEKLAAANALKDAGNALLAGNIALPLPDETLSKTYFF
jgi:hypothetical protein